MLCFCGIEGRGIQRCLDRWWSRYLLGNRWQSRQTLDQTFNETRHCYKVSIKMYESNWNLNISSLFSSINYSQTLTNYHFANAIYPCTSRWIVSKHSLKTSWNFIPLILIFLHWPLTLILFSRWPLYFGFTTLIVL